MFRTQNETAMKAEGGRRKAEGQQPARHPSAHTPQPSPLRPHPSPLPSPPSAFTLTELLVVITIIAILAGLVTAAAINALNKAKQARITLELQQLGAAMEDFKNEYGIYPPDVYATNASTGMNVATNNVDINQNTQRLISALKRISSRSTEFDERNSTPVSGKNNVTTILNNGLSPSEALVFWLQGFSDDVTRPLSGTDLQVTQISDGNGGTVNNVVTIDSRKPRFEFDKSRLRFSRDPTTNNLRALTMYRQDGTEFNVLLYEYLPAGSQQPYVYFDTSRDTPLQFVDKWQSVREFHYQDPKSTDGVIFPIKQVRADAPTGATTLDNVDYVEKGKFQILHCGLDDLWGNFASLSNGGMGGELDVTNSGNVPTLLAPTGPFVGDVADTVGNFMTGTLEDTTQ